MKPKLLPVALAALLVLVAVPAAPAAAKAGAPKSYVPKKGKPCKRGYRAAKRKGKRVCVKRKRSARKAGPTVAAPPSLQVRLGPTFARDPLNPFKVTYSYSAFAASARGPVPLPDGVLAFYSDGKLECAINVGGIVNSGECPVVYQELGQHRVTTIYSSGERSATATEIKQIDPLPTMTVASTSFAPKDVSGIESGIGEVGTLSVSAGAQPAGVPQIGCNQSDPAACMDYVPFYLSGSGSPHSGYTFPLAGTTQYAVQVRDGRFGVCFHDPAWEVSAFSGNGDALALGGAGGGFVGPSSRWYPLATFGAGLAQGSHYLLARTNAGPGYVASSATAPVAFTPPLPADPCAGDYGSLVFTYEDLPDPPVYEGGSTEVGTVRVERDPAAMNVFCSQANAISLTTVCIPSGTEELAVFVSPPSQSNCGMLRFEPANEETEDGPTFFRYRSEAESGAAEFYARGDGKWASGAMHFTPTLPPECEP